MLIHSFLNSLKTPNRNCISFYEIICILASERRVTTTWRTCYSRLHIDSCDKPSWVKSARSEYFECFLSVQVSCIKYAVALSLIFLVRILLWQHGRILHSSSELWTYNPWMVQCSQVASNEMPQPSVSFFYLVYLHWIISHQRPFTPLFSIGCVMLSCAAHMDTLNIYYDLLVSS